MKTHFTKAVQCTGSTCAIIHITTSGKNFSKVNYSRRMYAIVRRYTPEAAIGCVNECYANLTGLRTFFKMTYKEMVDNILKDLTKEIGVAFTVRVATLASYEEMKNSGKREKSFATYRELNSLFTGRKFIAPKSRKTLYGKRRRLIIPFLGKVA